MEGGRKGLVTRSQPGVMMAFEHERVYVSMCVSVCLSVCGPQRSLQCICVYGSKKDLDLAQPAVTKWL
jgi:hypothetical protein